jgi:hypothetical protein
VSRTSTETADGMKRLRLLSLLVAATVVFAGGSEVATQPAPVRIDTGLVSIVPSDGPIRVFKGIPYAAPPVGPLRWHPPQPATRWNGVRPADQYGPRCMQPADAPGGRAGGTAAALPPMSEDCLYLNVMTGATSASERRPVIVWSHGGALTIGAGSRDVGDAIARKGAVRRSQRRRSPALAAIPAGRTGAVDPGGEYRDGPGPRCRPCRTPRRRCRHTFGSATRSIGGHDRCGMP